MAAELDRAHERELVGNGVPLNPASAGRCHDLLHQVANEHEAATTDRFHVRPVGEDEESDLIDLGCSVAAGEKLRDVRAAESGRSSFRVVDQFHLASPPATLSTAPSRTRIRRPHPDDRYGDRLQLTRV